MILLNMNELKIVLGSEMSDITIRKVKKGILLSVYMVDVS